MLALTRDGGCGAVSSSVHCALLAASRYECTKIGPPVGAMELAGVTVKPVGAERLARTVRRARGVTKKQHGSHATFDEPTRHRAKKKLPKPQALKALEQIDLLSSPAYPGTPPSCGVPFANPTSSPRSASMT